MPAHLLPAQPAAAAHQCGSSARTLRLPLLLLQVPLPGGISETLQPLQRPGGAGGGGRGGSRGGRGGGERGGGRGGGGGEESGEEKKKNSEGDKGGGRGWWRWWMKGREDYMSVSIRLRVAVLWFLVIKTVYSWKVTVCWVIVNIFVSSQFDMLLL